MSDNTNFQTQTVTHVELPGSRRALASGAQRIRDLDPNAHVEVTVMLRAPALPDASDLPETALTPEQIAERYGASPDDIRAVETTLQGFGLRVEGVAPTGRSIRVSGTVSAMEAAFQAGLGVYKSAAQGEFRGREGTIQVPAPIAGLVTAVLGLDQRRVAQRKAAASSHAAAKPLTPSDLETRYQFPPGGAEGQRIGIAEFGSPVTNTKFVPPGYFPDDVAAFCKGQDRPVPQIEPVTVNLAPLTMAQIQALPAQLANLAWDETGEVMMDAEIVAALCSSAKISVYFATWDQKGWVDLLERAISDKVVTLSVSYGLAEDSSDWSPAALTAINDTLETVSLAGITVCVSSGDDGTGCDASDTRAHVEFPGSSPFVLSVGGTMLDSSGHEVVWWQSPGRRTGNGHSGATGGGVSAMYKRPTWQTAAVASLNPGGIDGRVIPDVAALAGPPFYQLTLQGKSAPNGGTSAAAPLWASLVARINAVLPPAKQQRFLAPLLYKAAAGGKTVGAAGCKDITAGNNASHPNPGKGYEAKTGFDAVTGWGVPIGKALLDAL